MFGIRFVKVEPSDYVLQYQRGRIVREGAGLSFFYFGPTTSLVLVPQMPEDGVIFSDGIESDSLQFNSGTEATIQLAERKGHLVT